MTIHPDPDIQQVYDTLICRAQRHGLNDAQIKVWYALVEWFDSHVEGPTNNQLARLANVSPGTVCWSMPVLEALGYITRQYRNNGTVISRLTCLWIYPENAHE